MHIIRQNPRATSSDYGGFEINIENLTPDEEIIHKLGEQIKRLQDLLEVSEKEHYKTPQRLDIATKVLELYADDGNWCNCLSWNGFMEESNVVENGQFGENGYEPPKKVQK